MSLSTLPRIGFGCMSLSSPYGDAVPREQAKATLRRAIEIGCTLLVTSDAYGHPGDVGHNEKLIGEVLAEGDTRSKVFLVTKFGIDENRNVNGSPEHARKAIAASIERLGTTPDAWLVHRIPKDTPIKSVVEVMEEMRLAGKTKYVGLGEPSARTLREASKNANISFIESEYSPFCLDLEDRGILAACKDLDDKILAYSPLGKGFLTGAFKTSEDMGAIRSQYFPRLGKDVFDKNYRMVACLEEFAQKKEYSAGQVALAWAVAQSNLIIPIPGTTKQNRLEENFAASKIVLSEAELEELRKMFEENKPEGDRYTAAHQALLDDD